MLLNLEYTITNKHLQNKYILSTASVIWKLNLSKFNKHAPQLDNSIRKINNNKIEK